MTNLYELINDLGNNHINSNPKLSDFAHVLCIISRLGKEKKEKAMKHFEKVYAKVFSDADVSVDTDSFYWKLLNLIYKRAKFEGLTSSISEDEEELFTRIIDVSQRLFAGSVKDENSIQKLEITRIQVLSSECFSGIENSFSDVLKEALSSIEMRMEK